MARTVELACPRCGHSHLYTVESTDDADAVEEISSAMRLKRLELLPKSLPVGGIITPV